MMEKILKQSLIVEIKGRVGIIMKINCGSWIKGIENPVCLDMICMYHLPRILGDYFVFECFNPACRYHA